MHEFRRKVKGYSSSSSEKFMLGEHTASDRVASGRQDSRRKHIRKRILTSGGRKIISGRSGVPGQSPNIRIKPLIHLR